ncbi:hypothetical protein ACIA5C_18285 [Actinoplanes sp. NPDC051343]|jgi:hypothetical protein|uniref:hypothetical protein n=1 Tax=Actinoplanes sp. NPDC051343 TaxID=3363906 RepID=UPI00378B3193
MTSAGWIALAITIFGAFAYAAASILQAVGARRSTGTVQTLGHPLYIVGTVCDLLAWAGSMVALRELAVYLVESVLAGSLAITVVAARIFLASRLRRRDAAAIVVTVAALTVLAMSAGPQEAVVASPQLRIGFCIAAVATALIGWVSTKVTGPGVAAGLAGLALGAAALCGRALALPPDASAHPLSAVLAVVTEPVTGALVVFAGTGMLLYASALQRGQVGPVTAVLWIAEVIVPSAMALLMLGDTVRPGWALPATIAGLVTVFAAVLLARAPASNDTAVPSAEGAPPPPPVRPPAPIPVTPRLSRGDERIIWWGPPPVWVPPSRPQPSVQGRPAAASLTSAPGHAEPHWRPPRPADADTVTAPRAAQPRWVTEEDQPDSKAVPRPRWMSELDDADIEAAFAPGWTAESRWLSEPDDEVAGETMSPPPEWPPRRPASMTTPVERSAAPRSPWHDL